MRKELSALQVINLAVVILIFAVNFSFSQTPDKSQIEWRDLGSEEKIAYIDISKLKSLTEQSTAENPVYLSWDKKSAEQKSFYRNGEMYSRTCIGGSVLRENVTHYCLPFADIGYHLTTPNLSLNGAFYSLNGFGLDVYYEADKNRFYFFSSNWNYFEGFGPFSGDPKIEIPKAVKPVRSNDLRLKIETEVSQEWLDPKADEEQEIIEKESYCDRSYCPPTPREQQLKRLNGLIVKFRVKNAGGEDLYIYLPDELTRIVLTKPIDEKDFYRSNPERRVEPNPRSRWEFFPRGTTREFELKGFGRARTEAMYLIYFNDKPEFWDEVEFGIKFPVKFRTFKNKS